MSRGLVKRGHQVRVVTLHSTRRAAGWASPDGIEVHYLPWLGTGTWQVPVGMSILSVAIGESDVVHGYGLYTLLCPAAAFLAERAGRPFVLEPLGMYRPRVRSLRAKQLYHLVFTSWMARRAARTIATSPGEREELAGLAEPGRLVLRRNGIDLEPFQALPPSSRFRAAHRIPDDDRLILYVGRISPIKNLEQLVKAFHDLSPRRARLVLVGPALEPGYARDLVNLIASLGLDGRVLMTGPLYGEEKLAALAAADLFVLPSLTESYGNAAAEAVAAGVPVLLTETCGIAPQIHRRAGLAVPLGVAALAEGMRVMLDEEELRGGLTSHRAEVIAELTWDEPLAQTEQLYQAVLGESIR